MMVYLHPKYGVNPSVNTCFWCGKDKEVVLFGRGYKNKDGVCVEAPHRVMMDYHPCYDCGGNMNLGVSIMECQEQPIVEGQMPIQMKPVILYPTGRWWVVKEDFIKRNMQPEDLVKTIIREGRMYVDLEVGKMMDEAEKVLRNMPGLDSKED